MIEKMADHRCAPQSRPGSPNFYRCEVCGRRYVYTRRYVGGESRERWEQMFDDMETRRTLARREADEMMRPFAWLITAGSVVIGIVAAIGVVAFIYWLAMP